MNALMRSMLAEGDMTTFPVLHSEPVSTDNTRNDTIANENNNNLLQNHIIVVAESKTIGNQIGLAILSVNPPAVYLSEFTDHRNYAKLLYHFNLFPPKQIILADTMLNGKCGSRLYEMPCESQLFGRHLITAVPRKNFNENLGIQYLNNYQLSLFQGKNQLIMQKYFCLSAIGALFKYLEDKEGICFHPHSLPFEFKRFDDVMIISQLTVRDLELVSNNLSTSSGSANKATLFGTLDHTVTKMGKRLLRTNILQPSTNLVTLNSRLDIVEEFQKPENNYRQIQLIMKQLPDLDSLLNRIITSSTSMKQTMKSIENRISQILAIKKSLKICSQLVPLFENISALPIIKMAVDLFNHQDIQNLIDSINELINEDVLNYGDGNGEKVNSHHLKIYVIKDGHNPLLDVARITYKETTDDIYSYITQLSEKYNIPLKPIYNPSKGYSILLSKIMENRLPNEAMNIAYRGSSATFSTLDLLKLNDRLKESLHEIFLLSEKSLSMLTDQIIANISTLFHVSESIALLDMLLSFTHYSILTKTTRPEFTDTIALNNARHPIIDTIQRSSFIPQNIYCSSSCNFQIITGPNMSGKSTLIRTVALLAVMAQIGVPVPCDYASFTIHDQIFTRISNEDDFQSHNSTFMMEMKDISGLLESFTSQSLIVIDELGRATAPAEGLAISIAISKALCKQKAFVFLTTHFHELAEYFSTEPSANLLYLQVSENGRRHENCQLEYLHKLERGINPLTEYGIALAQSDGFPSWIVDRAYELAHQIKEKENQENEDEKKKFKIYVERRKCVQEILQIMKNSLVDDEELLEYFKEMKSGYEGRLIKN